MDLFCGAGGLSLGLVDAGFRVLVGADHDEPAVRTHMANIGGLSYRGDLADPEDLLDHLQAWRIEHVDLLAGGVPCQPFSSAGRSKILSLVRAGQRSEDDPRTRLWHSFICVAERLRPRAVLLENVPDLALWDDGAVLAGFCDSLREMGYIVDSAVVNAFEHGVPQHRSRLFVIGVRPDAELTWPSASPGRVTVRDAIGDLPVVPAAQRCERLEYGGPESGLQRELRRGVAAENRGVVHDHITRDVRPDDAEAFALLREGQTYRDLPSRLQRYRADIFSDKYKRLEWEGLSRSITAHIAKDGYWYIHPEQHRTLSVREAARIQTFPDWFRFAGPPTDRYRQIGNAVPPLLARSIGRCLHSTLTLPGARRRPATPIAGFRELLLQWRERRTPELPWRDGGDAWHVLMAEISLRRLQPERARAAHSMLVGLAATPRDALSQTEEIRAAAGALGLHSRIERVLSVAQALLGEHGGTVPVTEEGLLSLPGVGEHAASAVLSFGHGRRVVVLDRDAGRVASRVRGRAKPQRWQMRLDLQQMAGRKGTDPAFNRALLDLALAVCRTHRALCEDCPVRSRCETAGGSVWAAPSTD